MTSQSFTVAVQLDGETHAALDMAAWEAGTSLVAYASQVLADSVKPKKTPRKTTGASK